jgi:hypothetical protein
MAQAQKAQADAKFFEEKMAEDAKLYAKQQETESLALVGKTKAEYTSRKKGFHSPPLVPNVFGPLLKGPSVPVRLKMWASGH